VARDRDAGGPGGRRPLPDAGLALLALPPDRFTAERDALAARLASAGDAAEAAEVRRLRRPVGLAWLLNRVARARPREVTALFEAGDRLRAGQRQAMAGGGARALREAEEALRSAARALRTEARALAEEVGRAPDPSALARLELLLRLVASAPGEARDALRRGVLEREPDVAAGDLSGLAVVLGGAAGAGARAEPPGGGLAKTRAGRGQAREARAARARAEPDRRDAGRRDDAARAREERLARERDRAREERERREAERREAAERARAEREARARDRARAAATRALARAEEEAAETRRRLAAAEERVAQARAALTALGPRNNTRN
jgi:hypothetical protein